MGRGRNCIESLRKAESLKLCDLLGPNQQHIRFLTCLVCHRALCLACYYNYIIVYYNYENLCDI